MLLFDKALIPWEDVLVYRDLRRATGFYAESGFANLYNFQSGIRLGVKLELMIGLLSSACAPMAPRASAGYRLPSAS